VPPANSHVHFMNSSTRCAPQFKTVLYKAGSVVFVCPAAATMSAVVAHLSDTMRSASSALLNVGADDVLPARGIPR
jgi:hypothetical protein